MKEHLTIRNFGPIREAEIDVRDLTIFVGPQATGKSLAAQALYFLRGIEELILPEINEPVEKLDAVLRALEWWFGNALSVYTEPGTLLRWCSSEDAIEKAKREIRWDHAGAHLSETLEGGVPDREVMERQLWDFPWQVYIPAGRALYSFLPSYVLLSRRRLEWPGYVLTFYETLGMAIESLWRGVWQPSMFSLAGGGIFGSDSELAFLRKRVESIIKGEIRYGPDTILLETEQKLLRSATISAGQMEIWPFGAIVEVGLKLGMYPATQIYFEEPETHLHPGAQRSVMEIIAFLVRKGVRFLLTTHSPYILYAVNNFLTAQEVLDAGRALPPDVPPETALRSDQVAAYRFSSDGTVHDIMDAEVGVIDEDELDQVADDLGATFTDLLERLGGAA